MTAGTVAMTEFINFSSGVRESTLPVPTRPRDIKAVDSLLSKLRIASAGRCSSTVFAHAFQTALGRTGSVGGTCYRLEFAPPPPIESHSDDTPACDAVADAVWFAGGVGNLVVFCASSSDAGNGREFDEINRNSPVLMWTVDAVPRAHRAISRLWRCCAESAGLRGASAAGDAFDDLGSDYEEHLITALASVPQLERTAKVAGIRAAYCAAHGLPTAPSAPDSGGSAGGSGAGDPER